MTLTRQVSSKVVLSSVKTVTDQGYKVPHPPGRNRNKYRKFRYRYKELKRLRDTRMTSSQLAAAKKQLIGQIGVASDNNENNALGMAKTFLHYNKYETAGAVFRRIEQLTPEILLEVANEMFAEDYLSTLVYD